jgi:hypothetical protein
MFLTTWESKHGIINQLKLDPSPPSLMLAVWVGTKEPRAERRLDGAGTRMHLILCEEGGVGSSQPQHAAAPRFRNLHNVWRCPHKVLTLRDCEMPFTTAPFKTILERQLALNVTYRIHTCKVPSLGRRTQLWPIS